MDMPTVSNGELQKWLTKTVYDRLPEDLKESFLRSFDEAPIRSLKTKRMPPVAKHRPGSILIGDALNMRHPTTGDFPLYKPIPVSMLLLFKNQVVFRALIDSEERRAPVICDLY